MNRSLYNYFRLRTKNSILKSVYYTGDGVYAIEAYDDTFLNVKNGSWDRKEKAQQYINKSIKRHMLANNIDEALVVNYSLWDHHLEYNLEV